MSGTVSGDVFARPAPGFLSGVADHIASIHLVLSTSSCAAMIIASVLSFWPTFIQPLVATYSICRLYMPCREACPSMMERETKMSEIAKLETCQTENCMAKDVNSIQKLNMPFRAYPDHSLQTKGSLHENKINNCFNTSVKMPTSPCGLYDY